MTKLPELTPIKSSLLNGHAYDPTTRVLHLDVRGKRYVYDDVPAEKVEAMLGSISPGRYFVTNIRDNFKGRKV